MPSTAASMASAPRASATDRPLEPAGAEQEGGEQEHDQDDEHDPVPNGVICTVVHSQSSTVIAMTASKCGYITDVGDFIW